MIIDRHNYEEFFILYLDNELTQEERSAVEQFAVENPDLGQELDMLMQTRLVPEEDVVFEHKDELLRFAGDSAINANNYEEWLLLYVDNELNTAQKQAVEIFAASNPLIQKELELLRQTQLQPEKHIVFPDKSLLYRKEETSHRPVIAIRWWRIAAAAAMITAVSATAWMMLSKNNTETNPGLANVKQTETPATIKSPVTTTGAEELPAVTTVPEQSSQLAMNDEVKEEEKKITSPRVQMTENVEPIQTQNMIADNGNLNNLPQPKSNPYVNDHRDNQLIAQADLAKNAPALTKPKENIQESIVTTPTIEPSDLVTTAAMTTDVETDEPDVADSGKKNKLRGFFRKVTLTFEKTTNMKATDEDDRLLVGSLAIKL